MNTLIISTFSCTFEEFKTDVTGFITAMGKEVVSEYEFVQAGEHKSHLLMNVLDMDALCAEMSSDEAKEWDKKNNCKDTVYSIELIGWFDHLSRLICSRVPSHQKPNVIVAHQQKGNKPMVKLNDILKLIKINNVDEIIVL